MTRSPSRRQFLSALALVGAGTGISALTMRGFRLPFMPEPRSRASEAVHPSQGFSARGEDAFFVRADDQQLEWRAFAPEPSLHIRGRFEISIDNLHPKADLQISGDGRLFEEVSVGLKRWIRGEAIGQRAMTLKWSVPFRDNFRFAAIGDSGGDRELEWVLKRSTQLDAQFLILIGDIYYQPGDDQNVMRHLSSSPIPVYAAIGNHDIVRGWDQNLLHWFENQVGPRNSTFKLGGIQFINLDTAADTLPWSSGQRGVMLRQIPPLSQNPGIRDYVVFSHRPITDLRPPEMRPSDHSIENFGEGEWLRQELLKREARSILNGHIHASIEKDDKGLFTYIAGEGMAHLDIVHSRGNLAWFDNPVNRVAKILVGDVEPDQPVTYRWEPLLMPFHAHCSQRLRADMAKEKGHYIELLKNLEQQCRIQT